MNKEILNEVYKDIEPDLSTKHSSVSCGCYEKELYTNQCNLESIKEHVVHAFCLSKGLSKENEDKKQVILPALRSMFDVLNINELRDC